MHLELRLIFLISFMNIVVIDVNGHNKYSAEANKDTEFKTILKNLDNPFRMSKLNLIWSKARVRLSEPKLKSIFGELKVHDKEEVTWKKFMAEGKDKDGLKEAELRKKLLNIMNLYGLSEHFENSKDSSKYNKHHKALNEASEDYINKSLFKDKKLNKLWSKAEVAGFTAEELNALKEEFHHHQDKIDEYYFILHDVKNGPDDEYENSVDEKLDKFNTITLEEEKPSNKDYLDKVNSLREKHRDLKDGYDRLFLLASKGPNSKEFVEPRVQGLWKIALDSNFTPNELESLRVELLHYENRLLKLRHLQVEQAVNEEKHKKKQLKMSGAKTDGISLLDDNIKKQARKIEKIHLDLETRIMQKHIEL